MRWYYLSLLLLLERTNAKTTNSSDPLDACWREWNTFWTANASVSYSSTMLSGTPETTTYVTDRTEFSTYYTKYVTTTTVTDVEHLGPANDPNAPDKTVVSTIVTTFSGSVSTAVSTIKSLTTTETDSNTASYISIATIFPSVPTPSCTLPAVYPPCQSQWDAFAAADRNAPGYQRPYCGQATVNDKQCQEVISNYYGEFATEGFTGIPGTVTSGTSSWWPTTQSFAPGCTLGCQTCAIIGDKVRILYWPASTASAVENGTATARLAPHTGGNGTAPETQTMVFEGMTLTSPTIYISYQTLYASDSCTGVGKTFSNTIIPLTNSQDLHSLSYKPGPDFGPRPGLSGVQYLRWEYEEMPFNFTDLDEPIPDEVYNQLPYCQMASRGFSLANLEGQQTFTCSREGPYNPVIAVPPEVRNLDPAWKTCTGWYAGLYDPPRALQGAPSAATPTAATAASTRAEPEPVATITHGSPRETRTSDAGRTRTGGAPAQSSHASQQHGPVRSDPSDTASRDATGIAGIIMSVIDGVNADDPSSAQEHDQGAVRTTTAGGDLPSGATSAGGSHRPSRPPLTPDSLPEGETANGNPANGRPGPATTVLQAAGSRHTIHLASGRPVIDGTALREGEDTVIGTNTVGVGPSAVYIGGSVWSEPTADADSPHDQDSDSTGLVFTISDEQAGPQTYTAHPVSGHPSQLVVDDGTTLTQGAADIALDSLRISLGTDGVLYTVPITSTTSVVSQTTASTVSGSVQSTSTDEIAATASPAAPSVPVQDSAGPPGLRCLGSGWMVVVCGVFANVLLWP